MENNYDYFCLDEVLDEIKKKKKKKLKKKAKNKKIIEIHNNNSAKTNDY